MCTSNYLDFEWSMCIHQSPRYNFILCTLLHVHVYSPLPLSFILGETLLHCTEPKYSYQFPMEYLERVKRTHERGGYGSTGYQYDWKFEEAQKNLLRTHTTAVSARMLYKLGQQASRALLSQNPVVLLYHMSYFTKYVDRCSMYRIMFSL